MYYTLRAATCALLAITAIACASSSADPTSNTVELDGEAIGWREFGLTDEQFNEYVGRTQDLIAQCMQEAGFEYVPASVEQIEFAQKHVRSEPGYDRFTYKEKWGLGVTTRFDDPVRDAELGEQNLAYYNSLSEADQVAFMRTLYGKRPDSSFTWMFDEEDFENRGGCTKEAIEAVFPPNMLEESFVNPKDVLVERDPRIIQAEKDWIRCMEEKGYEGYTDQDDFIEEYAELVEELVGDLDPHNLPPAKAKKLKQLQEEEIVFSLADVRCQVEWTDDVYKEVEMEVFGRPVSG